MDLKKSGKRSRILPFIIGIIVLIIVIVAIAVPLAIILPKRKHHTQTNTTTLLLPLYIYPTSNDTWSPLYDVVVAHPELQFLVIINPNSGPGSAAYPGDQYATVIKQVNSYPNVNTIGYVRTGYATRNMSDVLADVATYAGWSGINANLSMHGIFFDESPHEYVDGAPQYMRTINQVVKNSTGLKGARTIMHNPGVVPDPRFNDTNTDITVIFEHDYQSYLTLEPSLAAQPKNRSAYAFMINSVPFLDPTSLGTFVDSTAQIAEYIFVSNNNESFYQSFAADWNTFASVIPQ